MIERFSSSDPKSEKNSCKSTNKKILAFVVLTIMHMLCVFYGDLGADPIPQYI